MRPAQLWIDLDKRRSERNIGKVNASKAVNERRVQHRFVLKVLEYNFPDLFHGVQGATLSREDSDALVDALKIRASGYAIKHRIQFLIRGLEAGIDLLKWDVSVPSMPNLIPREPARFTPDKFVELQVLQQLRSAFIADLENPVPVTAEARLGQLLFSAIVYGGLLSGKWVIPWLTAIPEQLKCNDSFTWINMELTGTTINLQREKNPGQKWTISRRWFADPLTESLIFRLIKKHPDDLRLKKPINPQNYLLTYFKSLNVDKITLNALQSAAATRLSLSVPPYLTSYASGTTRSVSLPAESWARVYLEMAVPRAKEKTYIVAPEQPAGSVGTDAFSACPLPPASQERLRKQAIGILSDAIKNNHGSAESRRNLEKFLSIHDESLVPILKMVILWGIELLSTKNSDLTFGKGKEILPVSVSRYISPLSKVLLPLVGTDNIVHFDSDDLRDLYEEAAKRPQSKREQLKVTSFIVRFHRFIARRFDAPVVDFSDFALTWGPAEVGVDVNIITPNMFENVLKILGVFDDATPHLQKIRIFVAILGFRCGLRRGEARRIRIGDIMGETEPELLVRTTKQGRTKTRDSIRRLPLKLLLNKDELDSLLQFKRQRVVEEIRPRPKALLFCEKGRADTLFPDEAIFPQIIAALHQVSGDKRIRYHHLRHSFTTWLLVRLTMPEQSSSLAMPLLAHHWFNTESRLQLHKGLLLHQNLGRQSLFLVSMLCGHAEPSMTLLHYVHLCDWLLGVELNRTDMQVVLSRTAIEQLTLLKRAMVFKLKKESGESEWTMLPFLNSIRLHHKQLVTDPLSKIAYIPETTLMNFADGMSTTLLPGWALVQKVITDYQLNGAATPWLSQLYGLPEEQVTAWCNTAIIIANMKTRKGEPRHWNKRIANAKGFPKMARSLADQALVNRIFKAVGKLLADDLDAVKEGVRTFISKFSISAGMVRFSKTEEAIRFRQFLKLTGIHDKEILLLHFPPPETSEVLFRNQRQFWAKKLKLPEAQCLSSGAGNLGGSNKQGSVGILIIDTTKQIGVKKQTLPHAAYGFRYAMYLLAICQKFVSD